jgi:predicted ATP-dependent serine protease
MNDRQDNLFFDLVRVAFAYARPRRTCSRCGNRYRVWEGQCHRCERLDGSDLDKLRERIRTDERPAQDLRFVLGVSIAVMTAATIFAYIATQGK